MIQYATDRYDDAFVAAAPRRGWKLDYPSLMLAAQYGRRGATESADRAAAFESEVRKLRSVGRSSQPGEFNRRHERLIPTLAAMAYSVTAHATPFLQGVFLEDLLDLVQATLELVRGDVVREVARQKGMSREQAAKIEDESSRSVIRHMRWHIRKARVGAIARRCRRWKSHPGVDPSLSYVLAENSKLAFPHCPRLIDATTLALKVWLVYRDGMFVSGNLSPEIEEIWEGIFKILKISSWASRIMS